MITRKELLFLAAVLVLGIFLRSLFLTNDYLVDEAVRVNWANDSDFMEKLVQQTPTYSPLIYIILGTIHANVQNLQWERLIPLVLGCLAIVLGYFLGKHVGLEREMALLMAVLPHQVVYSIQLSAYIYLIVLGILYTHFLFFSPRTMRFRFLALGVIAGLGYLFHYGFLALTGATLLFLLYSKRLKEIIFYLAGMAPLFLINLSTFIAQRQYPHFNDILAFNLKSTLVTLADFPHFTYSPILIALTLLGIFFFITKRSHLPANVREMVLHYGLFLGIVLAGAFLSIIGFIPRYLIVAQPALMLGLFFLFKKNLSTKHYRILLCIYLLVLALTTLYIAYQFPVLDRIPLYY